MLIKQKENMNIPIMYGQITNNVELRSFAIQMAANISCDNVGEYR